MRNVPVHTIKELTAMSEKELGELQNSLGDFLDTPQEKEAKRLNELIREARRVKRPYGW